MSGDSIGNQKGVYGTKGIASSTNKPGVKAGALAWSNTSGNLWLFGGDGEFGTNRYNEFNDLWKYAPSTGQWTWVSGDSTSNQPGVYGTKGTAAPFSKPGARKRAVHWTDASGNLLLVGGDGFATMISPQGHLNDLWKYSPSTGWWTWLSGDTTLNQTGIYGIKGTAAVSNKPGARGSAVNWTDSSGNLLLFGGYGYVSIDNPFFTQYNSGALNDLWKYSPSTGLWTWMSGGTSVGENDSYGPIGTTAPYYTPGSRTGAVSWTEPSGNLWLFGEFGPTYTGSGYLSDFWKYSIVTTSLPVQLSRFTAQKQQQTVLLNWTTAQEQNSRYFIIERSSAGVVYDIIGNVAALGTTSSTSSYSFIDKAPIQGTNFYRLKQLDQDGRFLYSAIATVVREQEVTRFAVIQNPVQSTLQLSVQLPATQKLTLQVRDMSGHLLFSERRLGSKGSSIYALPVGRLTRGTYMINVQTENVSNTITFIKQ
jgi:hypothetical protein